MDWLVFIASLISSLAWPIAIVVLAFLFEEQLRALIDRVSHAKAGPVEVWAEVKEKIAEELAAAGTATGEGTAHDARVETRTGNAGGTIDRDPSEQLGQRDATVRIIDRGRGMTADELLEAIRKADTPDRLAKTVGLYVEGLSGPKLRALSDRRIELERDLYGEILRLQTARANGAQWGDGGPVAAAMDDVHTFWGHPEAFTDEQVADLATRIRGLLGNRAR